MWKLIVNTCAGSLQESFELTTRDRGEARAQFYNRVAENPKANLSLFPPDGSMVGFYKGEEPCGK